MRHSPETPRPATKARQSQPVLPQRSPASDALPSVSSEQLMPHATRPQPAAGSAQLLKKAGAFPPSAATSTLLQLQRQYGNRYVQRVVQLARPGSDVPSHSTRSRSVVQAKLTVTPAGDQYEQEADHVAERVVPQLNVGGAQHSETATGAVQRMRVQRKAIDRLAGVSVAPDVESSIQAARSGGVSLPTAVRGSMENDLGVDLSNVRVHTGGRQPIPSTAPCKREPSPLGTISSSDAVNISQAVLLGKSCWRMN